MHHTRADTDRLPASLQAQDRGKAFGVLLFSGSMGGMIGSLYATNLGTASKLNELLVHQLQTVHASVVAFALYNVWTSLCHSTNCQLPAQVTRA